MLRNSVPASRVTEGCCDEVVPRAAVPLTHRLPLAACEMLVGCSPVKVPQTSALRADSITNHNSGRVFNWLHIELVSYLPLTLTQWRDVVTELAA